MFDPVAAIEALVREPSVSTDPAFAAGMEGARKVLCGLFESMGLQVETVTTAKHPLILARRTGPQNWPHVIIYGHYDVQPPDPLELWQSPPFEPRYQGSRLYGRGVADNKAPMMVHIAAVARLLSEDPQCPLRVTFLIEGEEEIGSPSLPAILRERQHELQGDYILLSDTLNPSDEQVAITVGLRGMMCCEVELSGPQSDLHSGLHGGAVLNPIRALCELCASLHDADGRVAIPGFYDDVIQAEQWACEEIAKLDSDPGRYAERVGVPATSTPAGRTPMEATRLEPTLEFNGIYGGYQGIGEKTIIPAKVAVKISCRLVAKQDPDDIQRKVYAALRARCPAQVRMTIRDGHGGLPYSIVPPGKPDTPATQNPVLARAFRAADQAISRIYGQAPLYLPEGGSIPIIGAMKKILGLDAILLGMGTAENKLHAPNESFNMDSLEKGIAVSMAILRDTAYMPQDW